MKKRDKKQLELEFIYNELFNKMVELILRYNEPQMVASTMMAQSLRLYKTVFKYPGEFKEVITTILKQAENIEPYNHKTIH
jgi:hypothetical protein